MEDDTNCQNVTMICQPQCHKAQILTWTDLSITDMDLLDQLCTPEEIQEELVRIFCLDDPCQNRRTAILLDLYYYTLQFAREQSFTKEQTSAFFSIVKNTHAICVETPFGNLECCFRYFRDVLLCHAVLRPPFSTDLFSTDEVKAISEYVINTYFRHFKLYKYIFTPLVRLDLSICYPQLPPSPVASIAGDVEEAEEEQWVEYTQPCEEQVCEDQNAEEVDSAAASELRQLIRQHLSEEINRLKASIDQQIKQSEDDINQKMQGAEPQKKASAGEKKKGADAQGKASPKEKKKAKKK